MSVTQMLTGDHRFWVFNIQGNATGDASETSMRAGAAPFG